MEWLNQSGWWAWLGIPFVIALYLLRRKAVRHEVSSLLLWQRVECAQEAQKPFQRLRKQWLLWLQLLLVALLAVAVLRPAGSGGMHGELVFVFDVSASMQAIEKGKSRLERAAIQAAELVDDLQDGDTVTILTAGQMVNQPISRSTDKQRIKAVLGALKAENGTADMAGAISLALAMKRDLPSLSVIVFSDEQQQMDERIQLSYVGSGEENRGLVSLRCSEQGEGLTAFARVANYGEASTVVLECYADGVLCDIQSLTLAKDSQQNIQMQVPAEAQIVWVEIKTEDAMMADNVRYWVREKPLVYKALLVSDGNVFLEKALSLRDDIDLYKTTAAEAVHMEGYDLYLFDGISPTEMPEIGSIFVLSPGSILALSPDNGIGSIQAKEAKQSEGRLRAASTAQGEKLAQNLTFSEITLRSYRPLSGGESVLTWGEDVLLSVAENGGRRTAVLGFDLHDSNLPMKPDFPILIQNLMDFLLPVSVTAVEDAVCGQSMVLALDERTEAAKVVTPSGQEATIEGNLFSQTEEIGVYTLWEERRDETERVTAFALHIPPVESDIRQSFGELQSDMDLKKEQIGTGKEWTVYFLLAFLLLLLLEWEVSRRGN